MKFGILSISFGRMDYRELARAIGSHGFDATHLELKTVTGIGHAPGKMSTGCANLVAEEFAKHGVKIPVLGFYTNLIDLNEENRRIGINHFKEHLRFARDFGASTVTTETGTANRNSPWDHHPDNQNETCWRRLKETVEELAEEAEKWGVFVGLEGYYNNVVNTPERMERLLQEVPSANLGVVMDPCNYIAQKDASRQDEVIREAFSRLGERCLIAHAKDFNYREADDTAEHKLVQPGPGMGDLNYPLYLQLLDRYKPNIKIYLEHLPPSQMPASIAYIRKFQQEVIHAKE